MKCTESRVRRKYGKSEEMQTYTYSGSGGYASRSRQERISLSLSYLRRHGSYPADRTLQKFLLISIVYRALTYVP